MIDRGVWVTYAGRQPDRRAQERLCGRIAQLAAILHPKFEARALRVDIEMEDGVVTDTGPNVEPIELKDFRAGGIVFWLRDAGGKVRRLPFVFARGHASTAGGAAFAPGQLLAMEERIEPGQALLRGTAGASWRATALCCELLDYQFAAEFPLLMCYVRRFHVPRLTGSCFAPLPYWHLFESWTVEIRQELRRHPLSLADARGAWRSHMGRGAPGSAPDLPGWFDDWIAQKGTLEATAFGLVAAEFAG